ncbi:MAG: hypothetical protein MUF81_03635 [Verrucomicrobia bacterium]|nr:hypothetical protein [Verrucomicrobiota bacterium]
MSTTYQIVVCAGIAPDPLPTLEPIHFRLPIDGAFIGLTGGFHGLNNPIATFAVSG